MRVKRAHHGAICPVLSPVFFSGRERGNRVSTVERFHSRLDPGFLRIAGVFRRPKHLKQSIVRHVISGRRAARLPLANAHTVVSAHTDRSPCLSSGASRARPIRVTGTARSASPSVASPRSLAPRRRMCFSPPPDDPRGSARAGRRSRPRDARARRAPFPRVLDAARAPGRRAHVDSPDAPSIEPRLASDRRVVSPLPAGRSASGRENRSTEKPPRVRNRLSSVKPPSRSTAHRAFRFTKKIRTPDAAFTSPRATSRSST